MKSKATPAFFLLLCACTPAAKFNQESLHMLTATDFQTTGARVDFASALKDLGPPSSTQVNIRPCPSVEFNDISRIKAVLERAGYTRIGFGSPEKTRCK